ncbi:HAD-IA family hydrolase [Candidatus Halobeggiatoa sp. HSG11]|nr:HAD-IA family hydrolase [Candidatus Halobeggiatoa sp. HSG11]
MAITIQNKTYTGIIFDVDDTLIDTSKSYDVAIKKTVKNLTNTEINDQQIDIIRTNGIDYGVNNDWNVTWLLIQLIQNFPNEQWPNILQTNQIAKIDVQKHEYIEIKDFFQDIYLGKPHFNGQGLIGTSETKIYSPKFFPTLKNYGIKMAVVTSRPTTEAMYTLRQVNNLVDNFIETDLVISVGSKNASGKLIAEKPSPEPILECLQRMQSQSVVYIGNSTSDFIAAKNAGIDFIQVGNSQINGANYIKLNNINDILRISN